MEERALKDRNRNPWYILMTLYGEQEGADIDRELATKNVKLWNEWVSQGLSGPEGTEIAKRFKRRWKEKASGTDVPELPMKTDRVDMSGVDFTNIVALDGATLIGINFYGAKFRKRASFIDALFAKTTDFSDAEFFGTTDFYNAHFDKITFFNRAKFGETAGFVDAKFGKTTHFHRAEFGEIADFHNVTFGDGTDFSFALFGEMTDFRNATFGDGSDFSFGNFGEKADFFDAKLGKKTNFHRAEFGEMADFRDVTFGDGTDFSGVKFVGTANFPDTRFGGTTYFSDAQFGKAAYFSETKFGETTIFDFARFGDFSNFAGAVFGRAGSLDGSVSFANAIFEGPTSFERTTFTSHLPLLAGTILHETTTVTADDKYWPPLKPRLGLLLGTARYSAGQPAQGSDVAKASAAKLRHAMARQMLPDEEHFFYRREMHHAGLDGPWLPRLLILIFEGLSNFGYSIARPLSLLAILWVICGLGYLQSGAFADPAHVAGEEMVRALGFSFGNAFGFFGFQRAYFGFEFLRALPDWMQAMAATQTVLSFILLFFLGLGLRTRFRLR